MRRREEISHGTVIGGYRIVKNLGFCDFYGKNMSLWECECLSCGKISQVRQLDLKRSHRCCGGRKIVEVGQSYNGMHIDGVSKAGKHKSYNCTCLKCGNKYELTGQEIYNNTPACPHCREAEREEIRLERLNDQYRGRKFWSLTIKDIVRSEKGARQAICQCDCGKITEITLTRILNGGAKTCGHDRNLFLKKGKEINAEANIDGTNLFALDPERRINKNNTTGYTGVCGKAGRYRAYITFKRKQYHLGVYNNFDEAVRARERAEKEIWGNFLRWYAAEYPEQWERMKRAGS